MKDYEDILNKFIKQWGNRKIGIYIYKRKEFAKHNEEELKNIYEYLVQKGYLW